MNTATTALYRTSICVLALLLAGLLAARLGPFASAAPPSAGPMSVEPARAAGLPADSLPTITEADGEMLATFADAQALALDPRGRLYVADAARDHVVLLRPDGTQQRIFGGSGTQPGRFDTPTDVDPTNGLQLFVADAANGRIQRFVAEGRFLESLPVRQSHDASSATGSVFEQGRETIGRGSPGRPVAVVTTSRQVVFALDARHRILWRWDAARRVERLAGDAALGPPVFRTPVALALDSERRLYVADAGASAVWVFDTLGTFLHRIDVPSGTNDPIRSLTVHANRLWVVFAQRLVAVPLQHGEVQHSSRHAAPRRRWSIALSEPLVDVAFSPSQAYLLTSTRVVRLRSPGMLN